MGSDENAVNASKSLLSQGFFVPAIRPPTVPEGAARLRVTVSAAHDPADLSHLAAALAAMRDSATMRLDAPEPR
jgi:8-amino-7-oxononanoate synthase